MRIKATETLEDIYGIDAKLGLLVDALNERTTQFTFDLNDDEIIEDYGFGLDANGNYPAL